jgi:hypothetical protein
MTHRFEEVLSARGLPWMKVTGSKNERLHQAVEAIRSFFPTERGFAVGPDDLRDREAIDL